MRNIFLALIFLAWSNNVFAQTKSDMSAKALYTFCKKANESASTPVEIAFLGSCTYMFRGFVDGYLLGVSAGLRNAFIEDQQNLATTKGILDVRTRIDLLRPKAECAASIGKLRGAVDAFIAYMDKHPERSDEPYTEPLLTALEEEYCKK